jgi:hypothetical protein
LRRVGGLAAFLAVALVTLAALLAVRTVVVGGEVAGWDHSFHLTNAYLTYFFFLPEGSPLGYDPWHMFGWPPTLYYNLGTSLFVSLAYSFASPFLDFKSTYSLCVALSYALLAPALAALVHSMTGSGLAAVLAALAAVAVFDQENAWTDVGWRQVYYVGMWPQRWGLVTGVASAALFSYALRRRGLGALALMAGASLLLAWSLIAHVMMGAATALLAALIAVFRAAHDARQRGLGAAAKRLASALVLLAWSLALAAFWAVPLFETNERFHGLRTLTWEVGVGVIGTILGSYPLYLNALIPAGPLLPLAERGRRSPLAWALYAAWAAPTCTLLFAWRLLPQDALGSLAVYSLPPALALYSLLGSGEALIALPTAAALMLWLATGPRTYVVHLLGLRVDFSGLPIVEWFGYGKFAGYARYLLLAYFSAVAASAVSLAVGKAKRGSEERWGPALLVLSLVFAGFLWPALSGLAANTDLLHSSPKKFRFIEEFPLYRNVSSFFDALARLGLEGNTYLLIQDLSDNFADWSTFCHNHFVYELPIYTGAPIVGGIVWTRYVTQPISTTEYSRLFSVENAYWAANLEKFYWQLSELGISYVAVFDENLKRAMRGSPLFEEVLVAPPYSLFRTRDFHPIAYANGSARVELEARPNLVRIVLRAQPLQAYEVRVRMVAFPGFTAAASPEPLLLTVSTFNPRVAEETSRAWGYPVGSKIPLLKLTVVPLSETTVIELRWSLRSWGDGVSLAALLAALASVAAWALGRFAPPPILAKLSRR